MQRCRDADVKKHVRRLRRHVKIELRLNCLIYPYLLIFFFVDGSLPVMMLQAYYGISAISSIVLRRVASCVVASAVGSYAIH